MKVHAKNLENLQVEITIGKHTLIADEPIGVGDDTGPNPHSILLSALGACKVITVLMYARRKGWALDNVEVSLDTYKIKAKDCKDCYSDPDAKVTIIESEIFFEGDLSDEQITRLSEISEHCPVHRTLTGEIKILTSVKNKSE